jgi:hypothetical protein
MSLMSARSAPSVPSALPACVAACLLACGLWGTTGGCASGDVVVGGLQEVAVMPALPNRDLDLLFVIDNSPSMADKQVSLAESFPRMMQKLDQLDGGRPNLHIGVITSDMGTQGSAVAAPGPALGTLGAGGCAGVGGDGALNHLGDPSLTEGYLSDVATLDGRAQNYAGTLADEFSRLARVGAGGCGFEQHLAAMRRSLVNPANAGFLRPEANLAVVILADEDDCSALDPALFGAAGAALGPLDSFRCFEQGVVCDPDAPRTPGDKHGCKPRAATTLVESVEPFVNALLAVKLDPRQIMVAGVIGDPGAVSVVPEAAPAGGAVKLAASCVFDDPAGPETADPAVRLAAFLGHFPGRSQLTSICNHDLSGPLDAIGATAKRLVGDPCIDTTALADASPDPGIQPACEVTEVRDADPDHAASLPLCATAGAADCFTLVADAAACPDSAEHLRVRVQRAGAVTPDTWTHVRCQRAQ